MPELMMLEVPIREVAMRIGVPKEIKSHEYRVGLTPEVVNALVTEGHSVLVESGAGKGVGFTDQLYQQGGAVIVDTPQQVFAKADLIIKVKEPQPDECRMLRESQLLFAFLHLAPDPEQARLLLDSGATCIAYETVTDAQGRLPMLTPMSEVAGRMSIQAAAHHLEKAQGGSGVLLGGLPGVESGKVVILGGGVVGTNAAYIAVGMGADVTILDRSLPRLRELDVMLGNRIKTVYSSPDAIDRYVSGADVVVGSVLIPGASAPKLIRRQHLQSMADGSVIVDVAIDQGGCFETSKPTTHQNPTFVVDGVVHYCVANMPSGVVRTSTIALNNATMPFVLALANKGGRQALQEDPYFAEGLNIHAGRVTNAAVAGALGLSYMSVEDALKTIC